MIFAAAALFGGAIGILFAYAAVSNDRLLPNIATVVALATGLAAITIGRDGGALSGVIVGLTGIAGLVLTNGRLLAGHPRLSGDGYWRRTWLGFWHPITLRPQREY